MRITRTVRVTAFQWRRPCGVDGPAGSRILPVNSANQLPSGKRWMRLNLTWAGTLRMTWPPFCVMSHSTSKAYSPASIKNNSPQHVKRARMVRIKARSPVPLPV